MKLLDLDPQFASTAGDGISDSTTGQPVPKRDGIGLICNCPKCGEDHPLFVPFKNPMDGGEPTHPVAWDRSGETFETLTLRPSILRKDCGWHGFVTDGMVHE